MKIIYQNNESCKSQKRRETYLNPMPHKLPLDFRAAIDADAIVKNMWADITPLARNEWICCVTSAKKAETRAHRIVVGLDKMRSGMRRPCCWAGCPHR